MKRALQFLATRVVRSRAGLALLIALLVLGVVGAARVLYGPVDPRLTTHLPAHPLVVATATADDGLASPGATVSPTAIRGAQPPETVASAFATDWVAHEASPADWHDRLVTRSTTRLARQLAGVDPATVPAERITGDPVVIPRAATIVEVAIPVDTGTLRLRLIATNDRWLVDGVDWERA